MTENAPGRPKFKKVVDVFKGAVAAGIAMGALATGSEAQNIKQKNVPTTVEKGVNPIPELIVKPYIITREAFMKKKAELEKIEKMMEAAEKSYLEAMAQDQEKYKNLFLSISESEIVIIKELKELAIRNSESEGLEEKSAKERLIVEKIDFLTKFYLRVDLYLKSKVESKFSENFKNDLTNNKSLNEYYIKYLATQKRERA
jgi:hypothetical protein